MSQLLQTITSNDFKIDDEPIANNAFASGTAIKFLYGHRAWNANALMPFAIIPMREKIEITFTSTAVGDGTALVEIWGFVIDDDVGRFKAVSSVGRLLSI